MRGDIVDVEGIKAQTIATMQDTERGSCTLAQLLCNRLFVTLPTGEAVTLAVGSSYLVAEVKDLIHMETRVPSEGPSPGLQGSYHDGPRE